MTDSHSMVLMPNCQRKLRSTLASRATNLASRAAVDLGEDVTDGQFTGVRHVPFLARGEYTTHPIRHKACQTGLPDRQLVGHCTDVPRIPHGCVQTVTGAGRK